MKNKKGFTLIELLAVIVILGIILTIATPNVIKHVKNAKEKAKFIAAQDIVDIAAAYMEKNPDKVTDGCVNVITMENYLESNVTNPATGENVKKFSSDLSGQKVCKAENTEKQSNYEIQVDSGSDSNSNSKYYKFDGYKYYIEQ